MSVTYPDYSYTNFPDNTDTFNYFTDITTDTLPLAKEYYEKYNAGDIDGATAILNANPSLKNSFIGASTLNPVIDAIKAIELFYSEDVQQYLVNIVQDKGDFSPTAKYAKYNVVGYLINGAVQNYICLKTDTPIGTLPTNTTYWRAITLRGAKGDAGVGLTAKGAWNTTDIFPVDSMVAHNNALWGSIVESTNIEPTVTATDTWYKIIEFSSDLLTFTDATTNKSYALTVDNGNVYFKASDNSQINIALKSDIPTIPSSLPANGGNADTLDNQQGSYYLDYNNLTDKPTIPTTLPANGGNADTVDGYHTTISTSVPTSLSDNVFCFVYE